MIRTLPALAATAAALAALAAQDPPRRDPSKQDPPPDAAAPKKLSEWPSLSRAEQDRVRAVLKQFRKSEADLHAGAQRAIAAIGAGAAPILFPLVTDRADNVNPHLFEALDAIVDARHAALLAREVGRKSVELRRYLTQRLCRFRDADLLPVLQQAAKDADEEVAFHGALGLLALQRGDGLDLVLQAARQRWAESGDLIAAVLAPARSAQAAELVLERIAAARPTDQMAGLRLLRHLMVQKQASLLRTYLESSDFTVQKEAINAARVVHRQEPLEKLASFQAIEMAKQWLEKL